VARSDENLRRTATLVPTPDALTLAIRYGTTIQRIPEEDCHTGSNAGSAELRAAAKGVLNA
tara:strand:- start:6260 stop:6442 length:183 start_codon:yes stop_codon:yes gene_type:complete